MIQIGSHKVTIFTASGAFNFLGRGNGRGHGWPWHKALKFLLPQGSDYKNVATIGKTITLNPREWPMPLDKDWMPRRLFPDCIKIYPFSGVVINAVSLSGPGAQRLFMEEGWPSVQKPFIISFMPVESTPEKRLDEMRQFVNLFYQHRPIIGDGVGLEINLSCPNIKHDQSALIQGVVEILRIAYALKFDMLISSLLLKVVAFLEVIAAVKKVQESKYRDIILDCSNTVPFGRLLELMEALNIRERAKWEKMFKKESPLKKYGGGGVSGRPLLPIVTAWIKMARENGINVPIIGGGGILHPDDVWKMKNAGANAASIASVYLLEPWNVNKIIKEAEKAFCKRG